MVQQYGERESSVTVKKSTQTGKDTEFLPDSSGSETRVKTIQDLNVVPEVPLQSSCLFYLNVLSFSECTPFVHLASSYVFTMFLNDTITRTFYVIGYLLTLTDIEVMVYIH